MQYGLICKTLILKSLQAMGECGYNIFKLNLPIRILQKVFAKYDTCMFCFAEKNIFS